MNPSSTITHRDMTVEISDDLTFRIARLLWEDLVKEWKKPEPQYIPIPIKEILFGKSPNEPPQLTEVLTGVHEVGKKEPEKPPINRTLGGKGYTFVRNAPTLAECFIKFPNVPKANIERVWYNAHAPEKPEKPAKQDKPDTSPVTTERVIRSKASAGKGNLTKTGPWSDEEIAVMRNEKDKFTALKVYREKFPQSTRNDSAVFQRFNILKTARAPIKFSTPVEKEEPEIKKTTHEIIQDALNVPTIDANGKPLFVGAKVMQILANGSTRAFGVGTIAEITDGNVKARFPNSTKILPGKHFELYQPEASAEAMSK